MGKPPAPLALHTDLTDEELCQHARDGSLRARDELWRRYEPSIRKTVLSQLHRFSVPPRECSDVVQELYFTFLNVIKHYTLPTPTQDSPSHFTTYLHAAIRKTILLYAKAYGSRHKNFEITDQLTDVPDDAPIGMFGTIDLSPTMIEDEHWGEFLTGIIDREEVAAALLSLNESERMILLAHEWGVDDNHLAQELGTGRDAIKQRRYRILRRMKNILPR